MNLDQTLVKDCLCVRPSLWLDRSRRLHLHSLLVREVGAILTYAVESRHFLVRADEDYIHTRLRLVEDQAKDLFHILPLRVDLVMVLVYIPQVLKVVPVKAAVHIQEPREARVMAVVRILVLKEGQVRVFARMPQAPKAVQEMVFYHIQELNDSSSSLNRHPKTVFGRKARPYLFVAGNHYRTVEDDFVDCG